MTETPAHNQAVTHHYTVTYPAHGPRESDPHYADFHHFKKRRRESGTYHCDFAQQYRGGNQSECDLTLPLEAHHRHIEWALLNGLTVDDLEPYFPGISKVGVGAWAESDANLELLCVFHHRGHAGKHTASYADFEAAQFVRKLLS